MNRQFEKLTDEEQKQLHKIPVLVSVLAASSFNKVNKYQKADAIALAHLKTFTANPLLLPYYAKVGENFKEQFEAAAKKYFPFDETKRNALKKELETIYLIIGKLDKEYASLLLKSLEKYEKHVKKSGRSIFEDFIFPVPMPGLTD